MTGEMSIKREVFSLEFEDFSFFKEDNGKS